MHGLDFLYQFIMRQGMGQTGDVLVTRMPERLDSGITHAFQ
jgi:hypothetical protein